MNYSFEYIDIILLAMIAGFIFLRLRGILGKRTGFDGKTPAEFKEVLKNVKVNPLKKANEQFDEEAKKEFLNDSYIFTEVDKQAYLSSFAIANSIVVTCDSISMISEAATSGKPIFIGHMKVKKNNYRFKKFFQLFNDMGITKNLGEKTDSWKYKSLDEANRIAKIIKQKIENYDFS